MIVVTRLILLTDLLRFNSQAKHQQNQSSFNERFMDYVGNNALPDFIDVGIVQRCVEDLKKGKAAGLDGLTAEHVFFHIHCYMYIYQVFYSII